MEHCELLMEQIEINLQENLFAEAVALFKELNLKSNQIKNFNIRLDLRAQIDML